MKVGAIVHMYPPEHNAGAEWMLHHTLRWLSRRGHSCSVWVNGHRRRDTLDDVQITGPPTPSHDYAEAHDVILTHLDETMRALHATNATSTPLVHLVHNHRQLGYHGVTPTNVPLVVFNSKWLCVEVGWRGPQLILPPPVPKADYWTDPGRDRTAITLVNVSGEKGSETFYEMARRFPERRFIGVLGAYNYQARECPANVEIWPQTPRMRRVYSQTRILLMPSVYESYGRVGIEAGWSGIPTIYHPTMGLLESLGSFGLRADRDSPDEWEELIRSLDDPVAYRAVSAAASVNAARQWDRAQLALFDLERRLEEISG